MLLIDYGLVEVGVLSLDSASQLLVCGLGLRWLHLFASSACNVSATATLRLQQSIRRPGPLFGCSDQPRLLLLVLTGLCGLKMLRQALFACVLDCARPLLLAKLLTQI